MRSILAMSLLAALCGAGATPAQAAEEKKEKPAAKSLYVSAEETGNKMFFTMSGWHGTRNYWMAGAYQHHAPQKSAKKAEPKK